MLLLVASCVDRSLLVDTVRDYSAYSLTVENFRLEFLMTKIKTCYSGLVAHCPGFIHKAGVTRAR